jgi:hypothetical protein
MILSLLNDVCKVHSLLGTVARLKVVGLNNSGRIPGREQILAVKRPDWLRGPPGLLFDG